MKKYGFLLIASLFIAGCDNNAQDNVVSGGVEGRESKTAIYFPAGGGVDFEKMPISEVKGDGWLYKEYVVDGEWQSIDSSVTDILKEQGYSSAKDVHAEFLGGSLYTKKSASNKLYFRYKKTNTVTGEKTLVRVSWTI